MGKYLLLLLLGLSWLIRTNPQTHHLRKNPTNPAFIVHALHIFNKKQGDFNYCHLSLNEKELGKNKKPSTKTYISEAGGRNIPITSVKSRRIVNNCHLSEAEGVIYNEVRPQNNILLCIENNGLQETFWRAIDENDISLVKQFDSLQQDNPGLCFYNADTALLQVTRQLWINRNTIPDLVQKIKNEEEAFEAKLKNWKSKPEWSGSYSVSQEIIKAVQDHQQNIQNLEKELCLRKNRQFFLKQIGQFFIEKKADPYKYWGERKDERNAYEVRAWYGPCEEYAFKDFLRKRAADADTEQEHLKNVKNIRACTIWGVNGRVELHSRENMPVTREFIEGYRVVTKVGLSTANPGGPRPQ